MSKKNAKIRAELSAQGIPYRCAIHCGDCGSYWSLEVSARDRVTSRLALLKKNNNRCPDCTKKAAHGGM